ncbi:MAG: hypothetical protein IKG27_01545 [Bacilli bacterium]|nr:hypothetical protein [Bacilli bacterium]
MKRVVIFLTLVLLGFCIYLTYSSYTKYQKFLNVSGSKQKLEKINVKIKKVDEQIKEKEAEIKKLEESNKEKTSLLEVWQKEAEKLKNS